MYSWTPQISEITSTIGVSLPDAGRASYTGISYVPILTTWSPATIPSVSVLIAWASTLSTATAYPANVEVVAIIWRRVSIYDLHLELRLGRRGPSPATACNANCLVRADKGFGAGPRRMILCNCATSARVSAVFPVRGVHGSARGQEPYC